MKAIIKKAPQFITDKKGKKLSVVISMAQYQQKIENLEELEDIRMYDAVKARKEKSIPFTQYLQRRRKSMPDYQIRISKTAQKQLDKLPDSIAGVLI